MSPPPAHSRLETASDSLAQLEDEETYHAILSNASIAPKIIFGIDGPTEYPMEKQPRRRFVPLPAWNKGVRRAAPCLHRSNRRGRMVAASQEMDGW